MKKLNSQPIFYRSELLVRSAAANSIVLYINTRMRNGVKIAPFDRLLVHIFSLARFQEKFSHDFSSFVGPNTLLEWREFLSALKAIF